MIRLATGAGRQLAAQHSHSFEGWYAHIPGLKVLAPATIEDARYMLQPALDDPNPVLIFEHIMLYNREDELDPAVTAVDIVSAKIRRPGRDVTLITYGGTLFKTLEAAELLRQDGIEAEVIDLRVLRPLDMPTVLESVARTRRVVIIDEGWKSGSLSAEIAARIVEGAFFELDAPIRRVCSREVPIPYAAHLEAAADTPGAGDRCGGARPGKRRMIDFRMPSLGADMEAGTLVEWLVRPGDVVKRGEVVAVVETQKGAIEIEIFNGGVVSELVVPVGERVPVGTLLARNRRRSDHGRTAATAACHSGSSCRCTTGGSG